MEKWVEIRQQDFLTADLSSATVVTLYLSYDGNLALRPQLMRQLKPGTRIVSYTSTWETGNRKSSKPTAMRRGNHTLCIFGKSARRWSSAISGAKVSNSHFKAMST
jgi:hypothetical protein